MKTVEQFGKVQSLITEGVAKTGESDGYTAGYKLIQAGLLLLWIHTKYLSLKITRNLFKK